MEWVNVLKNRKPEMPISAARTRGRFQLDKFLAVYKNVQERQAY